MYYTLGERTIIGAGVHISDGCHIGDDVVIKDGTYLDYNCIIRNNVTINQNSTIGANSIIGEYEADWFSNHSANARHTSIGANSIIRSESIVYSGVIIGCDCQTGHRVTIREGAVIGNHCSIGTLSDIQGHCVLGDYVRCHSNVHIGMGSTIKSFVWIFPYVVLTNDPTPPSETLEGVTVESFAVIATASTILPGVVIHSDSLVAAGATVGKDVQSKDVVGGTPAKVISTIDRIKNHTTGDDVYPWRYHFDRGMPWEGEGFEKWYGELSQQEKDHYGLSCVNSISL